MRIPISELSQRKIHDYVEICGKIVYVDIGNKSILIKGSEY